MKYTFRLNHSFRAGSVTSITEPYSQFQINLFKLISLTTPFHVKIN